MKFTISRNAFIKKLNAVQRAISSKTTIPILTGLKLVAENDRLILTGSNTDISIETTIQTTDVDAHLEIVETGSIVLTARFFGEIVKKLPNDTLMLEVSDGFQTIITSGAAEFTINGLDANSFPRLPEVDSDTTVELDAKVFSELVSETVIAVSNQESRPVLTGIHFTLSGNKLSAVATDSHRLSQRIITLPTEISSNYDIIIPGKSLVELTRMLDDDIATISMQISENQALFTFDETLFYSRLLEGNYPDTSRLIPTESSTTLEFEAPELLASIERASLLSHEGRNNVVKLTIDDNAQTVVISGDSPEVGNVEEEVLTKSIAGESLEISFNPDYLKDALRSFGQTTIKVEFTSALRPFTLVPTEDQENFVQLITPVRTF
ncbi:DNA polymerase III subunit beta [Pediococcus claussenii]|uniref:Beta sliding clamp n=1 Tax=Pediococcus claussenii (strain ATCC BAA-344 / DSM 14800 / JCM 18046 / KCTC 3811 / LMG 21948 / P06) TaxID=701521 RepID=G8PE80_PEDCP|nr:DNA polymerase III subunit beta [Pediococcus claussenii]AEV94341.1 DNA polymerase III, beta subunit [Pediococcus claussenii ATCC BAA-344]ANZ69565.1 DNA polymerase III subunit beta [Pediococcus claussenii]ANZ71382.1 DNA polymerase III subunit beta [Pediococcus claussenii]KRN19396.1 dnaN protein [Pediococcus claussenii]